MTKIVLTAAAIIVSMGTAFAGSDHYDPSNANQPAASVDTMFTASTKASDGSAKQVAPLGSNQDLFGNR